MNIAFAPGLIDAMRLEARERFPEECCGLMVGRRAGARFAVTRIIPSPNVTSGDPHVDFEVDPALRIQLERELRGGEERLIGHYHSHPDGRAAPSARDLANAFEPELVWLIMAVTPEGVEDMAAYRLSPDGRCFEPLEIS